MEASHCLPIPDGVSLEDAAGLPETLFTVWNNVFLNREIAEGSLMLVHGGAGGIGSTAIQLGKALGLRVFATSGKPEGCAFCEQLGAERAINYREEEKKILDSVMGPDVYDKRIRPSGLNSTGKKKSFPISRSNKPNLYWRIGVVTAISRACIHKLQQQQEP